MNGAAHLEDSFRSKLKENCSQSIKAAAGKMLAWAQEVGQEMAKRTRARCTEIDPDVHGEWVICRPPLKGATSPSAMVARYSGPGWGWSPNPEKGKPFTNKQTALTEAFRHNDDVVSLEEARQAAPATIQVRAHERLSGNAKAQLPIYGPNHSERILVAAQRAVVAIRALQDLVTADTRDVQCCNMAVAQIGILESRVKHGAGIQGSAGKV